MIGSNAAKYHAHRIEAVSGILMVACFLVDVNTPLGVAIWALYIVPITVISSVSTARGLIAATALSTLLIFVGFYFSPAGVSPSLALLNRILGSGLIWFTTGVLLRHGRNIQAVKQSEAIANRLASIVSSSSDAIIAKDLNGTILTWNQGAEAIFGYAANEIVGSSIRVLIPAERQAEEDLILESLRRGEKLTHLRTVRQTKSGRLLDISVTTSPIWDGSGNLIGASKIARDISVQMASERELARMTRLYAALSQVNQAIVWTSNRDELFQKVCQTLVEFGGFHTVWMGWHNPETRRLDSLAAYGAGREYLNSIQVYADDRPEGCGPIGLAYRTGVPYICNDLMTDPATLPWRTMMQSYGFRSSAAFPIRNNAEVCGVLTVYSVEPQFFQDKEVALLVEAAGDVSFALDNFARDAARGLAEQKIREEMQFSDTMIESMPGVMYFYDSDGKFLRWNKNFEVSSGYSGEEIAQMRPSDFMIAADLPIVEQRIADVFAYGESSVEASFLAKDGKARLHFFTGRRVAYDGRMCLVGVGVDISDRRLAELRLAENERKYRELVEYANSIILRWNSAGEVTFLNEFGQKFFGYSAEEIIGRPVLETIVPPTDSGGRDLVRMISEICGDPESFGQNINENVRRNGERVWIAWTNRIVTDASGQLTGFLSVGTDITARRQVETALREAELRFHTLFEQTPVGVVVVDPVTTAIVECNQQAARQLGYACEELCGLRITDLEVDSNGESSWADIEHVLQHNRGQYETRHRMKSGAVRDVFVSARPLELTGRTVIHCVFLDITERNAIEAKVRESEARYRTLFEYAPDGIAIANSAGYYVDANASICRMLHYARSELIGLHASDIVTEAELSEIDVALQSLGRQADHHREWQLRRQDGSVFPAEVIATAMPDGNFLAMIRDITERKEAESDRERRRQAEAADRIKSAFLATMSHELRTPLNSIIGFTGIILQGLAGPLNPEQHKQLDMVRSSARHLLALVNDVLDISKIEAGQLDVAREPFDLQKSLKKVLGTVAPLAGKKSLELTLRIESELGEAVNDERRFEQIMLNLLSNAIKFTERGSVTIVARRIEDFRSTGSTTEQPAVQIVVTDTGIGIRPDDLETLFRPFRQIDSGLSRNHEGTGLGLAICGRLAGLMGGTIIVESTFQTGSTFTVTLPLQGRPVQ